MFQNTKIHGLFSTPVYETAINYEFSNEEFKVLIEASANKRRSHSNETTKDTFILDNPSMVPFKVLLEASVNHYLNIAYSPPSTVKAYITQSWLNYTSNQEAHHEHFHFNSFISGVYYLQASKNVDSIVFVKDTVPQSLTINSVLPTPFNEKESVMPVESGQLVLFPSYLRHRVNYKEDDSERVSLAFNTFLKGELGDKDSLTYLKL